LSTFGRIIVAVPPSLIARRLSDLPNIDEQFLWAERLLGLERTALTSTKG